MAAESTRQRPGDRLNRAFPFVTPELGHPDAERIGHTLHISSDELSKERIHRAHVLYRNPPVIHLTDEEAERLREINEKGTHSDGH